MKCKRCDVTMLPTLLACGQVLAWDCIGCKNEAHREARLQAAVDDAWEKNGERGL